MDTVTRVGRAALHAFATLALVSVSGCGGGGGGGGGAGNSLSTAGSLQLSASASSVPAGGQAVMLTATLTNSNSTVSWTLNGPGSLSASTGGQVGYTPPLPSQLGNATGVVVIATAGSLQRSVQIGLTSAAGSTWQVAQPPDNTWTGVRYLNGKFYAIEGEAVLSSPDGVHWSPVALPPNSTVADLAYGSAGFVAVGGAGAVLHSADGVIWSAGSVTAATDGTGLAPSYLQTSIVAFGNGVYVASGVQGVITSTDGINWVSRNGPILNAYSIDVYQIAFGNGRFVAMGYGGSFYSVDGINWTAISLPSAEYGVAFGNGIFVATNGSATMTSADGVTWTSGGNVADTNSFGFGGRLSFGGGRFYAYGNLGIDVSTDGVNWSQIYTAPASYANSYPIQGVAADATDIVQVGWQGFFEHSSVGGVNWTTPAIGVDLNLVAVDYMNGVWVALSSNGGSLLTSSDAIHWSAVSVPGVPVFNTITHGNGLFVAAGASAASQGGIYTSADGVHWTPALIGTTTVFYSTAYGNGRYVVGGSSNSVFTSTDGVNWTTVASGIAPNSASFVGLMTFGNGLFVSIVTGGDIYSSTDGVNWNAGPTGAPVGALTYGGRAGFVAVGAAGTAWHSTDGITWSTAPTGTQAYLAAIAYGDSQYVAAGAAGTVLISEDAVHWSVRTMDVSPVFSGAAFSGQAFVLVGDSGAIVTSTQ